MSDGSTTSTQRLPSLRWRLSLVILFLLVGMGAAFAVTAYREVERVLQTTGAERLKASAIQLASLLERFVAARLEETRRSASAPAIREFLTADTDATRKAAQAALAAMGTATQPVDVRVYDARGALRLQSDFRFAEPAQTGPGNTLAEGVGALRRIDDRIVFTSTADVRADTGTSRLGFLSITRSASGSPSTVIVAIERLIGTGSALKIGNGAGDVWTDFVSGVPGPPTVPAQGAPVSYTDPSGESRLGTVATIRGAPWLVWVDFRQSTLLAPARALLERMMPIALGLIVLGGVIVYVVSARLTRPIQRLAAAAAGIAGGDYAQRVPIGGRDEIGRLANAFNTMAQRVDESHQELERRVHARTRELENAIEALHRAQGELVLRERLAILGQLSSSVGHELRNPLGVMTNAIYYLEMIQTDAPDEVREYLGILRNQVNLAERIVSDLLDFARLKPPQPESVSIAQVIDQQCARLGRTERLTIERDIPPDVPPVRVDPVQIGQVLFNLLTNAQQAMDGAGVLKIRVRCDAEQLRIDVTDTGAGVAPELQDRIFEPLFTTKARGIGLGLSVSRSLAEANGGNLTLTSPPGHGATFTLSLPLAVAAAA